MLAAGLLVLAVAGCGEADRQASSPARPGPTAQSATRTLPSGFHVVGKVSDPTELAAYGGHLVWNQRKAGRWRLFHLRGRKVEPLPIATAPRPFRIDLGTDRAGATVLTYVRCASAERCEPHSYDLRSRADRRLTEIEAPGSTVDRVSSWGGDLAFVRRPTNGYDVELHLRTADGTTSRLPSGLESPQKPIYCGTRPELRRFCSSEIESLDLGENLVAHVWTANYDVDYSDPGVLHVLRRSDGRDRRQVQGYISGACGSVVPFDAQVRGTTVQYVRDLYNCSFTSTYFHRYDVQSRKETRVEAPELRSHRALAIAMARDGDDTFWLMRRKGSGRSDCDGASCSIIRSRGLTFRGLRKSDPRPSDGAENGTA